MILVTGSTGLLGKALCEMLRKDQKVAGISKRGAEGSERCDLSDKSSLTSCIDSLKPSVLIHTAAYSDVDGCERDPKLAYDSNVLAPKNLADICGARNIPWIHVSTDYVFSGQKRSPYIEEDATGPVNIYGMTKWIGEFYARNSASPCATVRTSWLFGPGTPNNFVNAILARLKKEPVVSVLDDQTDAPTSVKDLSEALWKIAGSLMKLKKGSRYNELFQICNAGETTRYGMTLEINKTLGGRARVEKTDASKIPNRLAVRPPYGTMSAARFEKAFGMKMRPWQDALREYVLSV